MAPILASRAAASGLELHQARRDLARLDQQFAGRDRQLEPSRAGAARIDVRARHRRGAPAACASGPRRRRRARASRAAVPSCAEVVDHQQRARRPARSSSVSCSRVAQGPTSLLPRTAVSGAMAASACSTLSSQMSPAWTMWSLPRRNVHDGGAQQAVRVGHEADAHAAARSPQAAPMLGTSAPAGCPFLSAAVNASMRSIGSRARWPSAGSMLISLAAGLQHVGQARQPVHRHPGAMRAALAGGAVAGGGRFVEHLAGVQRAQLVHHAVVGGDDELARIEFARRLEDGRGGTDGIGQRDHVGRRLRMHQHLGPGVLLLQGLELEAP